MPGYINKLISKYRRFILFAVDAVVICGAYLFTWTLINWKVDEVLYFSLMVSSCFLFVACYSIIFFTTGMYDSLWRYAEIVEFFRCAASSVVSVIAFLIISLIIFKERRLPISVYALSAAFASSLTLYIRLTYRMFRNTKISLSGKKRRRVLLVGAGDAASTFLHEHHRNPVQEMNVICAVDDDKNKQGRIITGVEILGTTNDIPDLVATCQIDTILICIPTLDGENRSRIIDICSQTPCNIKILPDIVKILPSNFQSPKRLSHEWAYSPSSPVV